MLKVILFATLILAACAWTEEGNVLVLGDEDFPAIMTEFPNILIEFYAPWCGHCKKLAPVYLEVADALKAQDAPVRVAKVDATEHPKAAGEFGVKGYPTLFYFHNGEKIDYTGQRNKEGMLNWLLKKTREPVTQIDAAKYASLSEESSVFVVYHGDFSAADQASVLKALAIGDDYNTYYWGTELGKEAGTVELIRNFDSSISYPTIDDGLKAWVTLNQRAVVVDFDERTIGEMFGSAKKGVVLFNGESDAELLSAFTEAAKEYSSSDSDALVFTQITKKSEHLENFANYIKVDHKVHRVILVDASAQQKYVMQGEVSKENLIEFFSNHADFKFGLTDEVKSEDKGQAEEEL